MPQPSHDAVPAIGVQQSATSIMRPVIADLREIMGLQYWDVDLTQVARFLVSSAMADKRLQVYFVNAHCVNVAARNPGYAQILKSSPFLFADGAGMALAARVTGKKLSHNVNGTDLFPELCAIAAALSVPVAFLGARPGIAAACATQMQQKHPGLEVAWVADGYLKQEEEESRLQELNASGARILFIAKGVPEQELWISTHAARLSAPVVLGVGALFDFYSGAIPRAPLYLRKLRLEWLYRLWCEPRRLFRRYVLGNPEFIMRVLLWRLRHS